MEYTGIEPVLLDLKLRYSPGSVAHIHSGPTGVDWDIKVNGVTKGDFVPALRLPSVADAIQCIIEHLAARGEVWIGYDGWKIYNYFPSSDSSLLYLKDFRIVKLPGKDSSGDRNPPTVEFEGGVICSRMNEFLDYFGLENNYYNRGRVKVWLNSLDGPVKRVRKRKQKFNRKKVISFEMGKNRFGKPTAVLRYQHLPPMVGLSPILETFPEVSQKEIEKLYKDFGIKLPSTFRKLFKDRPQVQEEPQVEEKPRKGKKGVDYYGAKYKMYKTRQGYLNFVGAIGEMVAMDPGKLYEMLIQEGEEVSRKQAAKIWSAYMEEGDGE